MILNRIKCLACNVELISRNRHDYVSCGCPEETFVDGGLDYQRCGSKALSNIESTPMFDDEPFEVQRDVIVWGTYGKDGDQPLSYKKVKDMDVGHLEAVLEIEGVLPHIRKCMKEELILKNTKPVETEEIENER